MGRNRKDMYFGNNEYGEWLVKLKQNQKTTEDIEKIKRYDGIIKHNPRDLIDYVEEILKENQQLNKTINELEAESKLRGLMIGEKDDKIQQLKEITSTQDKIIKELKEENTKLESWHNQHLGDIRKLEQDSKTNAEIVKRLKDRLVECETNSRHLSAKDDWKEYSFQIQLIPELKSILNEIKCNHDFEAMTFPMEKYLDMLVQQSYTNEEKAGRYADSVASKLESLKEQILSDYEIVERLKLQIGKYHGKVGYEYMDKVLHEILENKK